MSVLSSCEILTHVLSGMIEILHLIFNPPGGGKTTHKISVFYEILKRISFQYLASFHWCHVCDTIWQLCCSENFRFPFCSWEEQYTSASHFPHFL